MQWIGPSTIPSKTPASNVGGILLGRKSLLAEALPYWSLILGLMTTCPRKCSHLLEICVYTSVKSEVLQPFTHIPAKVPQVSLELVHKYHPWFSSDQRSRETVYFQQCGKHICCSSINAPVVSIKMLHYRFFPWPCKFHIRKSKEYRRNILENVLKKNPKLADSLFLPYAPWRLQNSQLNHQTGVT